MASVARAARRFRAVAVEGTGAEDPHDGGFGDEANPSHAMSL